MYRKLLGRAPAEGVGVCVRPIEAWTEQRTRTDWRTDCAGEGALRSPPPPAGQGAGAPCCGARGDTRGKRACSRHIYILWDGGGGAHRFRNSHPAPSPAPVPSARRGPPARSGRLAVASSRSQAGLCGGGGGGGGDRVPRAGPHTPGRPALHSHPRNPGGLPGSARKLWQRLAG